MKGISFLRAGRPALGALLCGLLLLSAPAHVDAAPTKKPKQLDIADSIAINRITTKFAAMLQNSDLASFLSSRGPFTVFVPTDSAFSRMSPDVFAALLRPENKERLQAIILYHVVNGKRLTSKDLATTPSLLSCQGAPLAIHVTKSGAQTVQKVRISNADIRCQNGIIMQIDAVLMPPEKSLPPLQMTPPAAAADTNAHSATAPASSTDTNTSPVTNAPPANVN